ncbi:amidohydrolase family protein [Tundrisphaera sp. TA3]|uniref:amidohydrolase family protein n=1 Tax=Tundrisphaera sp. TA3 TaxID=3435775 RepID=UPI003EB729AE
MHRRHFLQAAISGAMHASSQSWAMADDRCVPVIDTHLHCFARKDDARFPYDPDGPYQPDQPATPEHLLKCMAEAGVDNAVVVHPEPYGDDHRYLEHCLEVGRGKLKGTCLFFADRPGSLDRMSALVRKHKGRIIAARIHAYAPDRLPLFGKPELRALWKHIGDLGLAVQIHFEPRYAPGFEPLIKEFPETTVIIDHLGRPFQGSPQEYTLVLGWAKLTNTVIKLSSLQRREEYPHRDVGPVVKNLVRRFGPDRLIYGGGFGAGATGSSYRAYRERARSFLADLSDENQAKVLGGTAARLYWSEKSYKSKICLQGKRRWPGGCLTASGNGTTI